MKTMMTSLALLAAASTAAGGTMITFGLNTSSFPAGDTYTLNFQLNDGSGLGNANNTAILSLFGLGGGSASGSPTFTGGASGALATQFTLTDSAFFNQVLQDFLPGTLLQFTLDITTNTESGGTPDQFSFAVLRNGVEIPTTSAFGDVFLSIDIVGGGTTFNGFASSTAALPINTGAPTIVNAVPEPWLAPILGLLVPALAIRRARRWTS